jgi:hypothetical protein
MTSFESVIGTLEAELTAVGDTFSGLTGRRTAGRLGRAIAAFLR